MRTIIDQLRRPNVISNLLRTSTLAVVVGAVVLGQAQAQTKTPPASTQPGPTPGMMNQTPWFSSPQIRQQLKINEEQFNNLNNAYRKGWENYVSNLNKVDPTLSESQRQARMNELQQNFNKDFSAAWQQVLTDPTQRQRYEQLFWQYRGYTAFSDPTVMERLKLTPEQRARLNQFQQDWSMQMSKLGPMYQTNRDMAIKQFNTLQTQNIERLNSVLTPEQRTAWQQMTGTPYTFAPDVYFGTSITSPGVK